MKIVEAVLRVGLLMFFSVYSAVGLLIALAPSGLFTVFLGLWKYGTWGLSNLMFLSQYTLLVINAGLGCIMVRRVIQQDRLSVGSLVLFVLVHLTIEALYILRWGRMFAIEASYAIATGIVIVVFFVVKKCMTH